MNEPVVNPGSVATFEFTLNSPEQTGSYREYFNLVNEGVTWLNNPNIYLPIYVVSPVSIRNSSRTELSSDSSLFKGDYLLSSDGQSSLIFQEDGNVVYYSSLRKIWETNTMGSFAKRLTMQPDGNLVLYDNDDRPLWYSSSFNPNNSSKLVLQSDGNMVIYSGQQGLWSIGYVNNPNLFASVTQKMEVGRMVPGQIAETADRKYKFILQPDGNLVLYSGNSAVWSTMTIGPRAASYLRLQEDGNMVLYNKSNQAVWSSKTDGYGVSSLLVQEDGNVVLYGKSGASWFTRLKYSR
jgi:hypothetical protein